VDGFIQVKVSAGSALILMDVSGYFGSDLGPVTNVAAVPTSSSIGLSWTNPSAASLTGVMIRRAAGATPPATATAGTLVTDAVKPATSYSDTLVTPGTQYSYALFAHDGTPVYAGAANVTSTTLVDPVTGVYAIPGTESVALSWANPVGGSLGFLTGVTIRRGLGFTPTATTGTLLPEVLKPATTVTDSGLAPGTYTYALFAHYGGLVYSAAAPVTATTLVRPGPVTLPIAGPDHTWIALSWTNPPQASLNGVMIRRATGATPPASATAGTPVADVAAGTTSFTDTLLTPDTQYSYAFFAHDATHSDGSRFYSASRALTTRTFITSIMVSTGSSHTCAVTNASGVKCWGSNGNGQLGDNTNDQSLVPVDVSTLGAGAGVVAVSAGASHTCAVTSLGVVKCWGSNGSGELGNGTNVESKVPAVVAGLDAVAVSAGSGYTCAVTRAGGVKCWGDNFYGVLGNNTNESSVLPVDVIGLGSGSGAKGISAGRGHACAVTTDDAVRCWGLNYDGQLGNGTNTDSRVPVEVSGLGAGTGSLAVSAGGYHTCAVTAVGGVKCWGNNGSGELGNNETTGSNEPVDVSGLGFASGAVAISTGLYHSCAVMLNGAAKCWGANFWGEVGNNSNAVALIPVDVVGLASGAGAIAVSAGESQTCAVATIGAAKDGAVKCWGSNINGQLGDGSADSSLVPVNVVGLR
jgi:alpha-tubulin suppressor-like RCC1 family protein